MQMTTELTLEKHILATPGVRSGKPRLSGTRITVADVAIMHLRLGQSLAEIAGEYELSLAAVHAAMSYYYDHRDEIEAEIAAGIAFAEALQRQTPSRL
jgi:uncharacterized protein (DUF433 family)